jgi:putative thiamine transport system permease protein
MSFHTPLLSLFASRSFAAGLAALVLVPLAWSLFGAIAAAWDLAAWQALLTQPQLQTALGLSLWTGLASSALAWAGAAVLLSGRWGSKVPAMLALPHAAFAIGVVLLVSPSGWLLRLGANLWGGFGGVGLESPPDWPTTQDPWGVGLIVVLALKEMVFLLWMGLAVLQRPDFSKRLRLEMQLAQSMGYSERAAWWRVGWPQLSSRLVAPLGAVFAYSLSVVDVALVIGPTAPPTLGVLAWQWLQDADPHTQAQGAAAAWLLLAVSALVMAGVVFVHRTVFKPWARARLTLGAKPLTAQEHHALALRQPTAATWALLAVYSAVGLALGLASVTGVWLFPALWPQTWTSGAWAAVASDGDTLWTSVWLGLSSASAATVWVLLVWEWWPLRWRSGDRSAVFLALLFLPLLLPAALWALGLHRLALEWGWDASDSGVWLAHTLSVTPYVALALYGPLQGFDSRLRAVAATLGHGRWAFVWRVQWPLLRGAIAAAFAVGFAVSVAQYLPTLYVGAGRFDTVTTQAVALSSGGQRSLMAAYAALQWVLPVVVFAVAAWVGRARRFGSAAFQPRPAAELG